MRSYYFLKNGQSIQRISLEGDPPARVEELHIAIEPNCKVNVSYNLGGNGLFPPSIFCHDQTTGNIFYYFDDRGNYVRYPLGNIPVEWELQLVRIFDQWGSGEFGGTQIFGHNLRTDESHEDYGKAQLWNNIFDLSKLTVLTTEDQKIGPEWELMLGDVNGDHYVDIVGRRTTEPAAGEQGKVGDLKTWFIGSSSLGYYISGSRYSGQIGLAWKLQVADMNFDGKADLFGYDDESNLWAWYNVTDADGVGRFNAGKSYGRMGIDWQHLQVTTLRTSHLDILGIATNGEVHSWPLQDGGLRDNGANIGGAMGWLPLGGLPLTRVA